MKKVFLGLISSVMLLTSCTTTSYVVSNSANVNSYNFAAINNFSTDIADAPALCGFEVKLFDSLSETNLKAIGSSEIMTLTENEHAATLLINTSFSRSNNDAVITLIFVEALTGRPVASCTAEADVGMGYEKAISKASDKIIEQVKEIFVKSKTAPKPLFSMFTKKTKSEKVAAVPEERSEPVAENLAEELPAASEPDSESETAE